MDEMAQYNEKGPPPADQALAIHRQRRRHFLKFTALGIAGLLGVGAFIKVRRWRHIVIHHSAGHFGDVAFLNRVHRQRQPGDPVDSMAYHLVVGNGNGLAMGEIAQGLRWRCRLWGAHVSARNTAYNLQGIGICLIGNYQEDHLPGEQYASLVRLVRGLMAEHRISPSRVHTHGRIPGEQTLCPGRNFPYNRFYMDIA